MASTFTDENAPAHNPLTPKPRGQLPVPTEVEQVVARENARSAAYYTAEAEKRIAEDLTLQYYFEGETIAYRRTTLGVEVVAVGLEEIRDMVKSVPPEELPGVSIGEPSAVPRIVEKI
jgi:hypothetical protein